MLAGFLLMLAGFLLRQQDMISSQHQVRRNEQTTRVCAESASVIPIRRKAYFFHFSNFKKLLRN